MLIKRAVLEGIEAGTISLAFRRWRKPGVKAGSEILTELGRVRVTSVAVVAIGAITAGDASPAGYDSLAALKADLAKREGTIYRIGLAFAGADPRVALRSDDRLDAAALDLLLRKLERLPWARDHLARIGRRPAIRAADLAAEAGLATQPFKLSVRKLKSLGLTESLAVGYRLSPRGEAVLKTLKKQG